MNIKAALIALARDFSTRMQKKNMQSYASSTAFFLIVSLIPMLILLSSVLPYTTLTEEDLVRVMTELTPDFADNIMMRLVNEAYGQSVAVFSISAVAAIWTGALGMLALIKGLNTIYDVDERRNYFYLRFIAALYTIAMIVIVLIMLVIMVFGDFVKQLIVNAYPHVWAFAEFFVNFKFIMVIGIATFAFALIYTFVPSARMKFIYQLPGAVFSAIVWYVFSWLFSLYVSLPNSYSIYGSLATPVIMMFWLYFCIYIFLIGAFINRFFHPAVKVLYDDHHMNKVRKNAKKKSTKVIRKHREYNEFR
ncbi:YihY/virulence factor BrkB family protein [Butyrivibrio sp. VCB2006]|uniref:YihY/virulence factor BrkB family protein n=1 Tax=Butyrivibrio sp. VCB2006 TaxID=1280679 RepID=UPI0003FBA6CB|nr:YihY/virulence factor BrkB family protein [Butyrivibrio sp. VCB2006]